MEFRVRQSATAERRALRALVTSSLSGVSKINGKPAYMRVDTRLGWRVGESFDVSIVAQNLLTPRHLEYPVQYFITSTPVQRSVSVRFAMRF
jgi:hypothetical protein